MIAAPSSNREALAHDLTIRGWKDPAFHEFLLRDPKSAIENHLGHVLPENVSIVIHAEDLNTIHLVLPHLPQASPLTDEQLERLFENSVGETDPPDCTAQCSYCSCSTTSHLEDDNEAQCENRNCEENPD